MSFWKKNKIDSEEYQKLLVKFTETMADLNGLKARLSMLETSEAEIRGKINKRLAAIDRSQEKEEKTKEFSKSTQNLNTLNPFS